MWEEWVETERFVGRVQKRGNNKKKTFTLSASTQQQENLLDPASTPQPAIDLGEEKKMKSQKSLQK